VAKWARITFISISICLAVTLFIITAPVLATSAAENPGDVYIFEADSPVTTTHPASQQSTKVSGGIAVWQDSRPDTNCNPCNRIFYKDLFQPDSAEQALTPGLKQQGNPAIDGDLVAWQAVYGNTGSRIWYQFIGSTGPGMVSDASTSQSRPAVSGTRIVWQDGRTGASNPQIYIKDLSQGSETAVSSGPGQNVSTDISGDWVVWIHNDNFDLGIPAVNDVYAKNVATGELRHVTADGGDVQQGAPAISGSKIIWEVNASNNHSLFIYDLNTSETGNIPDSSYATHARLEGNIIVWEKYTVDQIFMHDLTTGITQQVSSGTGATITRPDLSSGFVVWQDDRAVTRSIFMNKIDMKAQELAERYRPELRMTLGENFEPMPVEQFLSAPETYLEKRNDASFGQKKNPTAATLVQYAGTSDLYIDLQGDSIAAGGGNPSHSIDHGKVYNDYAIPYQSKRDDPANPVPRMMYTRVVSRPDGSENSFIQYWLLYYANDQAEIFHEGDWEVVQVDLDGKLKPYRADYSQHGYGQWRNWDENIPGHVEKSENNADRPVVYVGLGSHANYFTAGTDHPIYYQGADLSYFKVWDDASGSGNVLNSPNLPSSINTQIKVVPEADQVVSGLEFDWLKFMGQWGEYTNADIGWEGCAFCIPPVPALRISGERDGSDNPPVQGRWTNAFAWNDNNCDGCQDAQAQGTDTQITALSPVDIHLFDSHGRHTGKNSQGGVDQQIPNSEYLEYPTLHRKSIIIHGSDINEGYRFEAVGNGTGPADFIVTAPDHPGGSVDTLNYNAVQINPTTTVTMNLDASKNYTATIDTYGDGDSVIEKTPDTTTTNSVDFTTPAPVSDLAVAGTSAGSATLAFTAPGDDGNTGTATAYDLRYTTALITDQTWKDAVPVSNLPTPQPAGSAQTITVNGLDAGTTYYFAVKAMDEAALYSPLSNVVMGTTTIPRLAWTKLRVYWASWADYQNRQLSIDYRMSDMGTGIAIAAMVQASFCNPSTVYATTQFPLVVGDINPGSNRTVTIKYFVPATVGSFTTTTYATCSDDIGRTYWLPGPMP